jgi:hypothetical protein
MLTEPILCTYCEKPATLWRIYTPEDECDTGRDPICVECAARD